MVSNEKRGKLNAKDIKYLFLAYCEGTKVYRLMCLKTNKNMNNKDIAFIEDSIVLGMI